MFSLLADYLPEPPDDTYPLEELDDEIIEKALVGALERAHINRQEHWELACLVYEALRRGMRTRVRDYQRFIYDAVRRNYGRLYKKDYRIHLFTLHSHYHRIRAFYGNNYHAYMASCLGAGPFPELEECRLAEVISHHDDYIEKPSFEAMEEITRIVLQNREQFRLSPIKETWYFPHGLPNSGTLTFKDGAPDTWYVNRLPKCIDSYSHVRNGDYLRPLDALPLYYPSLLDLAWLQESIPLRLRLTWNIQIGRAVDKEENAYPVRQVKSEKRYRLLPAEPNRMQGLPENLEFLRPEQGPDILSQLGEDPSGCQLGPVTVGAPGTPAAPGTAGNWGDTGVMKPVLSLFNIGTSEDLAPNKIGAIPLHNAISRAQIEAYAPSSKLLSAQEILAQLREQGYGEYLDASLGDALNNQVTFFRAAHGPHLSPAFGNRKVPDDVTVGVTIAPAELRDFYRVRPVADAWVITYPTPEPQLAREIRQELNRALSNDPSPSNVVGYARNSQYDYVILFLSTITTIENVLRPLFLNGYLGNQISNPVISPLSPYYGEPIEIRRFQ